MAESLKAIKAKVEKQVKLLEISDNKSKRLFERRKKGQLKEHLKHG